MGCRGINPWKANTLTHCTITPTLAIILKFVLGQHEQCSEFSLSSAQGPTPGSAQDIL